jgi:hypothetical protein
MLIARAIDEPIREGLTHPQLWEAEDDGLIACWEAGRQLRLKDQQLALRASLGELVPLPWKGGGSQDSPSVKKRVGTFFYLAMWQGLRGEDLKIDPSVDVKLTCTAKGTVVTFTSDQARYSKP